MGKLFGFTKKLRSINGTWQLTDILNLYRDTAYYIVYDIMIPYKNYVKKHQILAQKNFNKIMIKLQIEVKYNFTIYQNL